MDKRIVLTWKFRRRITCVRQPRQVGNRRRVCGADFWRRLMLLFDFSSRICKCLLSVENLRRIYRLFIIFFFSSQNTFNWKCKVGLTRTRASLLLDTLGLVALLFSHGLLLRYGCYYGQCLSCGIVLGKLIWDQRILLSSSVFTHNTYSCQLLLATDEYTDYISWF